jgi:flagellar biosynthesis protein FlhG
MASSTARRITLVDGAADTGALCVARNLAAALTQQGRDVLLLDEVEGPQSLPSEQGARLVLVHAALCSKGGLSPLAASADHIVVVCTTRNDAITQTYLRIKKLHFLHEITVLRVLVNEAVDLVQARRTLTNLAATSHRYLGLAVQPAGFVKADSCLAQAKRLNQTVVQAFRSSACARDFYQIASDLVTWPCSLAPDPKPVQSFKPLSGPEVQLSDCSH